ncbi:MAG: beta-eliminating lyase-related protein [bacterium]
MKDLSRELLELRSSCDRFLNVHGARTAADLLAEIPTDLGLDRYGDGGAVKALEDEMRAVLGKPACLFLPSGTMAQQIALRIHADRRGVPNVAFHPTCHLALHEQQASERLHGLRPIPLGDPRTLFGLDDLRGIRERLAAVLFELPQREIGGRLPDWGDLEAQVEFVRERGAAAHLDGARLWECTPYYERTPAEIAAPFDSVYVSLYKGLGALAGCCLAGDEDFVAEARTWRRRHGGTLFGLWPNAASGLAALRRRLPLMPRYYEHARAIADELRRVDGVEIVPDPPQTPMMHLRLRVAPEAFLRAAIRIARERRVFSWGGTAPTDTPSIRTVEFTAGDATLELAPREVAEIVGELVGSTT